jgi:hypothetical protein
VSVPRKPWRFAFAIELAICTILVGAVALNALRRMDFLGDKTAQHIRMTDESRSAYVAKNIADGDGYVTNDLPAALVDFYDQRDKLHDKYWVNADRFPFAPYATAVVYWLTGSTSWKVGILAYNLVSFVGFLVVLYAFSLRLWRDRYAALATVTLALIHAYTFQFLYWKDGDMLLLTTLLIWASHRYLSQPDALTWKLGVPLGTLLAFVFLSRPNLGAAFILLFVVGTGRRMWRARAAGWGAVVRRFAVRELLVLAVAFIWCVPFMIHSLREWSTPLFSANNMYQMPLGTRFGMGTDTWWKYTQPGDPVTLGRILSAAPGELGSKFTSSWAATLKSVIGSYFIELLLAFALFGVFSRRASSDDAERDRPLRLVAGAVGFALVTNLALLPMYGYQNYNYRHYLGFGLPLLWLAAGRSLSLLVERLRPPARRIADHLRAHATAYLLAVVVCVLAWNLGAGSAPDANRLFTRTTQFVEAHWAVVGIALLVLLAGRWLWRPPWYPRLVALACILIFVSYRPNLDMKRANFIWFPANDKVWEALRAHTGVVSSFALQGEVAWNTGRRNIPAPEWPMHVYSILFDHGLAIEDLYIESADAQISTIDGPFSQAAAGFEGYARLQHYRFLPGYELAFHDATTRSYPKFRIKPHPKASTVFHLADRSAVDALAHSPDRIDLSDPHNVIYTAHGWGDYYQFDGHPVVAGTGITRSRYVGADQGPWEDTSITFFLDDRHPRSIDFEFYAPMPASYELFWNLDLYAWDPPSERASHSLGTVTVERPGWQHARLDVPARLTRNGLNKLGFRVAQMQSSVLCPAAMTDDACRAMVPGKPDNDMEGFSPSTIVVRPEGLNSAEVVWISLFARTLELHY